MSSNQTPTETDKWLIPFGTVSIIHLLTLGKNDTDNGLQNNKNDTVGYMKMIKNR